MNLLWQRISRPWTPGAIITVTALVAVVAGFALGRYTTLTRLSSVDEVSVEGAWTVETVYPASADDPVLDDLADLVPVEHTALMTSMYPNTEWNLVVVEPGDYDMYAACRFTEPRLVEYGGSAILNIRFHPDGPTVDESLTVECDGRVQQVGETVRSPEPGVIMLGSHLRGVYAEQVTIGTDLLSVLVDGQWLAADYGLVVYLVPH